MTPMKGHEMAGGIVRRSFSLGERKMMQGQHITGDELRAMPVANRNALIENRFIEVQRDVGDADGRPRERVVMEMAGTKVPKRFYVMEGVRINKKLLSEEEAQAIASTSANQ